MLLLIVSAYILRRETLQGSRYSPQGFQLILESIFSRFKFYAIVSMKLIHGGVRASLYYISRQDRNPDEYWAGKGSGTGERQIVGYFFGAAAPTLGLKGEPIYEGDPHFKALMSLLHPHTLEPLRQGLKPRTYQDDKTGTGRVQHPVVAIDITTSMPKEVTTFWAASSSSTRPRIDSAHAKANATVMQYLQETLAQTRTGRGGKVIEEGTPIIGGQFHHFQSRTGDPQRHTHNVVFAAVLRADGKWGALDTRPILKPDIPITLGQIYRDTLRAELQKEFAEYHLQFPEVPLAQGKSFSVVASNGERIPSSLLKEFSKRTEQIEKELENHPEKTRQRAVLDSRDRKPPAIDEKTYLATVQATAKKHGFDAEKFLERSRMNAFRVKAVKATTKEIVEKATHRVVRQQLTLEKGGQQPPKSRVAKTLRTGKKEVPPVLPAARRPVPKEEVQQLIRTRRHTLLSSLLPSIQITHDLRKAVARAHKASKQRAKARVRRTGYLYLTGKISDATYRSLTQANSHRTKIGIELNYHAGRMKLSQRLYLRTKYGHGLPSYSIPTSRLAINVAYATRRLTRSQQLSLLNHYGHLHSRSPEIRSLEMKRPQKVRRRDR